MKEKICPLGTAWRDKWDAHIASRWTPGSPDDVRVQQARKARVGRKLKTIKPRWRIAPDDARYQPPKQGSGYYQGSPSHRHTDFKVDDTVIHVDCVSANKGGPGRSFKDIRIFVNGVQAGRGSSCGCSLGGGGSEGPAVALVGSDKLLFVKPNLSVGLWKRGRRKLPLFSKREIRAKKAAMLKLKKMLNKLKL